MSDTYCVTCKKFNSSCICVGAYEFVKERLKNIEDIGLEEWQVIEIANICNEWNKSQIKK